MRQRVNARFWRPFVLGLVLLAVIMTLVLPSLHSIFASRRYGGAGSSEVDIDHEGLPPGWGGFTFPVYVGDLVILSFETFNASYDVFLRFSESVPWSDPSAYPYNETNVSQGSFRYLVLEDGMLELSLRAASISDPSQLGPTRVAYAYTIIVIPNPTGLSLIPRLA